MCSEGMTFGVSAIAAMTSSVKSAGCGEVKRTRSSPSTDPHARNSLAKAARSPNSTPYAFTFWPSSVTSLTPSATSASISARMSPGRRSFSLPRSDGTMQNVHVLLHPTEMETHAAYADSRRVGRVEGNTSSDSRISTCASACTRARSSSTGSDPMLCVPKTTSTQGARRTTSPRSFCAMHPPTAICSPGWRAFTLAMWPRLPYRRLSAFSRTAHVLNTTTSAPAPSTSSDRPSARDSPAASSSPLIRSESWTFIWHP